MPNKDIKKSPETTVPVKESEAQKLKNGLLDELIEKLSEEPQENK